MTHDAKCPIQGGVQTRSPDTGCGPGANLPRQCVRPSPLEVTCCHTVTASWLQTGHGGHVTRLQTGVGGHVSRLRSVSAGHVTPFSRWHGEPSGPVTGKYHRCQCHRPPTVYCNSIVPISHLIAANSSHFQLPKKVSPSSNVITQRELSYGVKYYRHCGTISQWCRRQEKEGTAAPNFETGEDMPPQLLRKNYHQICASNR